MSFQFTGEVQIPMVGFWEWALFAIKEYDEFNDDNIPVFKDVPEYNGYDIVLTPEDSEKPPVYIDGSDFWVWVHQYFPVDGAETRCSEPEFNEGVKIKVVMGSDSPEGWADECKPEWLK